MNITCPIRQKHGNFACEPCRMNPGAGNAPVECPEGWSLEKLPYGLGDRLSAILTPVMGKLGHPCVEQGKLKPGSPCAKRRDALNKLS